MLDKSGTATDIRTGNAVRIRRTWRSPHAGRLGVVSAIEPNEAYGAYVIEFEDGLHFRYHRHELEPQYWLDLLTFINVRLTHCVGLFVSFRVDRLNRLRGFDMCDRVQTPQPITRISGTEFCIAT